MAAVRQLAQAAVGGTVGATVGGLLGLAMPMPGRGHQAGQLVMNSMRPLCRQLRALRAVSWAMLCKGSHHRCVVSPPQVLACVSSYRQFVRSMQLLLELRQQEDRKSVV